MKTYSFKVVLEPDVDGHGKPGWSAHCPALVNMGAASSGFTQDEALRNLREAVELVIEGLLADGQSIPTGPHGAVEVSDVSLEAPKITLTA